MHVHPDLVVEIAFDGVQRSTRYPGGMALRFARVKRYRPDKLPEQADTIETVRAIHEGRLAPVPTDVGAWVRGPWGPGPWVRASVHPDPGADRQGPGLPQVVHRR